MLSMVGLEPQHRMNWRRTRLPLKRNDRRIVEQKEFTQSRVAIINRVGETLVRIVSLMRAWMGSNNTDNYLEPHL